MDVSGSLIPETPAILQEENDLLLPVSNTTPPTTSIPSVTRRKPPRSIQSREKRIFHESASMCSLPSLAHSSCSTAAPSIRQSSRPPVDVAIEARMQRRLKYHFMNPWEKYQSKGRIPYKLLVQLLKILLVTIQLIIFGHNSASHVTFRENSLMAFRHLFLKGWDASQETPPYPASHGPFAVYTDRQLYEKMTYAAENYFTVDVDSVGNFDFPLLNTPEMYICRTAYRNGTIFPSNESYTFDSTVVSDCFQFEPIHMDNGTVNFDAKESLSRNNVSLNFDSLLTVVMKMALKSVQLRSFDLDIQPDCFVHNITISFDNTAHDGVMMVTLTGTESGIPCHGTIHKDRRFSWGKVMLTGLDVWVLVLSCVSLASCVRSLMRGYRLYREAKKFFEDVLQLGLAQDKWEFLNGWFLIIIINDVLLIIGSIYKLMLDNKSGGHYEVCGYLLGIGSMLVWFGVLRYVAFSYKNNILLLTLRTALPNVMRFLMCALSIFIAFALCGWVVLGPYHVKFRTFSSSLECLFSLMNGDDLYTTFTIIPPPNSETSSNGGGPNTNNVIFLFSRVYMYGFCCLFIYVVLNLVITIIIEAYEDVKEARVNRGYPNTPMWNFILACPDVPGSASYRHDDDDDYDGHQGRPRRPWNVRRWSISLWANREKIHEEPAEGNGGPASRCTAGSSSGSAGLPNECSPLLRA